MVALSINNFTDEITTELLKKLVEISRGSIFCKSSADQLRSAIEEAFPVIQEIKYSGVELPQARQSQLDRISEAMRDGLELCHKVVSAGRWNPYKNLRYARKMEDLEKKINRFVDVTLRAHLWAEIHHTRAEVSRQVDQLHRMSDRLAATSVI